MPPLRCKTHTKELERHIHCCYISFTPPPPMAPLHLLLLAHILWSTALTCGSSSVMELEQAEFMGLSEVLGSLLDDPMWGQLHPLPCTETPWPGVECEVDQAESPPIFHITKIHIGPDIVNPPCKSSAHLSQSLGKLPFLKTLSIFNCFTESPVFLSAAMLEGIISSLEHLTLESNPSLVGQVPSILGQAQNLRVLCLSQNGLEGEVPKELGGLENLEQLDLSYNNLSGEIPEIFGGLRSLSILDLSFNSLEGHVPTSLGYLNVFQKLGLCSNKLDGIIPSSLGQLGNLVLFDLSNNLLNGPIPSSFSSLGKLEYLLLDHNPINSNLPNFMGALKNLRTLSMSNCGIIGEIPTSVSSLRSLTALSLDKNNLSGKIPQSLGSLPNLGELNLSQNKLSGEFRLPEEFVYRLGKRLDVGGNNGLCKGKASYMTNNVSDSLQIRDCLDDSTSSGNSTVGDRAKQAAMLNGVSCYISPWFHHFQLLFFETLVFFLVIFHL